MKGTKIVAIVTLGLWVLASVPAVAQFAEETEDYDNWEEDTKPGIRVYSGSSEKSVLSEAAKQGLSVVISGDQERIEYEESGTRAPDVGAHTVKTGDTLWDICRQHFGDPYVWPRVWSYNQTITNPNWIYPGDMLWLTSVIDREAQVAVGPSTETRTGEIVARKAHTMLLRNRGFVDKEVLEKSGEIVGSQKETRFIAQNDEAYVEFEQNPHVQPGDEYVAYRVLRGVKKVDNPSEEAGKLVEILGDVRVTTFDKDRKMARIVVDETTYPLERGTLIGPMQRRFDYIEPVINEKDLNGHIIAILDPNRLAANQQVVFVDRGVEHGVRDGNRFFAVQNRDAWRESRKEKDDREGYPTEVLAELRVVEARPTTATCIILNAVREIEVGHPVEMRKGF